MVALRHSEKDGLSKEAQGLDHAAETIAHNDLAARHEPRRPSVSPQFSGDGILAMAAITAVPVTSRRSSNKIPLCKHLAVRFQ